MNKCKRRFICIRKYQTFRTYSQILYAFLEQIAKHIISNFADKGSCMSQFLQQRKHIAWRSARICLQQPVSLTADTILCKIDKQFTYSGYIIFFLFHSGLPLLCTLYLTADIADYSTS